MNSKSKLIMNIDSSDLPAHQLHTLYQLHSDMTDIGEYAARSHTHCVHGTAAD